MFNARDCDALFPAGKDQMAVIIIGIEFPANCLNCRFKFDLVSGSDGRVEGMFCDLTGERVNSYSKHPDCPVREYREGIA